MATDHLFPDMRVCACLCNIYIYMERERDLCRPLVWPHSKPIGLLPNG